MPPRPPGGRARSPRSRLDGATPAHPAARTASEHLLTSQRPACGVLTLSRLRPQAAERAADAARAAEEAEGEEGEREAVTNYAAIGKRSMYWDAEKLGDKLQGLDKAGAAAALSPPPQITAALCSPLPRLSAAASLAAAAAHCCSRAPRRRCLSPRCHCSLLAVTASLLPSAAAAVACRLTTSRPLLSPRPLLSGQRWTRTACSSSRTAGGRRRPRYPSPTGRPPGVPCGSSILPTLRDA